MKMRHARRAILSVIGAVALVFAFAYQAAAQPRPDALPPVVAAGLPAAYQPAALHHAPSQLTRLYAVRHGDTLSKIAAARCGKAADWTGIFAASRAAHRTGANPNLIYPGQLLVLSCLIVAVPHLTSIVTRAGPARSYRHSSGGRTWDVSYGYPNYCGDGDGDGWDVSCGTRHTASSGGGSRSRSAGGTYHGSGSMQQCIIAAESGGNSQVMNSSGHYGLYQFSAGTWAASGGNPADFGHASVAEQNQAYYNAVAARGYSDWAPYDGCL
jgi:hypothetical protein